MNCNHAVILSTGVTAILILISPKMLSTGKIACQRSELWLLFADILRCFKKQTASCSVLYFHGLSKLALIHHKDMCPSTLGKKAIHKLFLDLRAFGLSIHHQTYQTTCHYYYFVMYYTTFSLLSSNVWIEFWMKINQ